MNRMRFRLIIVFILLFITACNSKEESVLVKNGTYVMELTGEDTVLSPYIIITSEDIIFSYDALSSYLPYGTYSIANDILTMNTDDDRFKYVFQIDEDKLIFQKNESSSVRLIDNRFGIKITDKAEFKLKDE